MRDALGNQVCEQALRESPALHKGSDSLAKPLARVIWGLDPKPLNPKS